MVTNNLMKGVRLNPKHGRVICSHRPGRKLGRLDYPVVSLEEYVFEFLKECFFGRGLGDAVSVRVSTKR